MATPVDIIGGFYTVGGRSWAAQDCVNYLPMAAEVSGTKTQTMLRTPPGLRPWVKVGDGPGYAIRGMHDVEGALFVVSGSRLYQISNKGIAIPLGTIPGVGRVSMAHNQIAGGNQLLVVNGNAGYVWNTLKQTFERVTDEGYPGASVAQFVNSYLMQLEPFGRFLFFSDLADATAYNTLDRFEAEAQPDPVVSILTDQNEVVAFGTRTMQFFENTGAAQGTFQSKGVVISRGCAGRFTPVKIDNSLAWLGDDGVFYRLDGYSPRRISTHAIEEAIAGLNWSQAFGMVWTDQGHTVAYWTFPDGQTWGYDVSSGLWHRRASYHPNHEVSRRWRPSTLVRSNGQWIAGDATSGKLFVLDWDYMLEDEGQPLVSERTTQIAFNSGSRFSVDSVDLWMRTGEKPTAPGSILFPVQPAGPTITGDAPYGYIGQSYSYQYTLTVGDAPIVSVTAIGLPDGWEISNTGLLTGDANEITTISLTLRVTDSNGLWDEIFDTVRVQALLVGFVDFPIGDVYYLWRTAALFEGEVNWVRDEFPILGSSPTRKIMMSSNSDIFFSSNLSQPYRNTRIPGPEFLAADQTFQDMEMSPLIIKDYGDDVVIGFEKNGASGPLGRYMVSSNKGVLWTVYDQGGKRISDIAKLDSGRWVSHHQLGSTKLLLTSDDEIPTEFTETSFTGWDPRTNQEARFASTGDYVCLACSDGFVRRTTDGLNYSTTSIIAGTGPNNISRGWRDGVVVISIGNSVFVSKDKGVSFVESGPIFPDGDLVQVRHIERAGDRIIVMSGQSSATAGMGAYCDSLGDGEWVVIDRPPSLTEGVGSVAVIGAV